MMMIMVITVILGQRMTFQMGKVKLTVLTPMLGEFPEVLVGGVAKVEGVVVVEDAEGIDQCLTPSQDGQEPLQGSMKPVYT